MDPSVGLYSRSNRFSQGEKSQWKMKFEHSNKFIRLIVSWFYLICKAKCRREACPRQNCLYRSQNDDRNDSFSWTWEPCTYELRRGLCNASCRNEGSQLPAQRKAIVDRKFRRWDCWKTRLIGTRWHLEARIQEVGWPNVLSRMGTENLWLLMVRIKLTFILYGDDHAKWSANILELETSPRRGGKWIDGRYTRQAPR